MANNKKTGCSMNTVIYIPPSPWMKARKRKLLKAKRARVKKLEAEKESYIERLEQPWPIIRKSSR